MTTTALPALAFPVVIIDPVSGNPDAVVEEIAAVLERILKAWIKPHR